VATHHLLEEAGITDACLVLLCLLRKALHPAVWTKRHNKIIGHSGWQTSGTPTSASQSPAAGTGAKGTGSYTWTDG